MIAILGATGTIGRSLAYEFASDQRGLALFARNPERLDKEAFGVAVSCRSLDQFSASNFELVVNAIGAGDPSRVAAMGTAILDLTGYWDRRVLDTMSSGARYVFLSSGVVHGAEVSPYVRAKRNAEALHRGLSGRSILDLRLFAYADKTLPHDGRFFLSDLKRSVSSGQPFITSDVDLVRDYVSRIELASLIRCWEAAGSPNSALDIYSKAPVRKLEMLELAKARYGVSVQYCKAFDSVSTAATSSYVSYDRAAAAFGYDPKRTSLEIVGAYLEEAAESKS